MAAGDRNRNRNKGGGKKGGQKKSGGGKLRRRAVGDVQMMMQPQFDYNNAQLQQTQENYQRAQMAAQQASRGAFDMIGEARNPGFDRIADQFTENLNALAPEFGGGAMAAAAGQFGMPENEVAAANALGGAIGSAGLSGLANDDARWGMLREGAQREATIFGRNSEAQLRQQMLDALRQHENEQQNLMAQQPWQIKSRLDELKDQAIEQQLAKSKMRSDAAFSKMLQEQLMGMRGGFGGGGGGGGGGAGGGGGGGGPTRVGGPAGTGTPSGGMNTDRGTVSHANIDNYGGRGPLGPNQQIMQQVRTASNINELPGWVRYAYNRQGATPRVGPDVLLDPERRRLYNTKIAQFLARTQGPTWPEGS